MPRLVLHARPQFGKGLLILPSHGQRSHPSRYAGFDSWVMTLLGVEEIPDALHVAEELRVMLVGHDHAAVVVDGLLQSQQAMAVVDRLPAVRALQILRFLISVCFHGQGKRGAYLRDELEGCACPLADGYRRITTSEARYRLDPAAYT